MPAHSDGPAGSDTPGPPSPTQHQSVPGRKQDRIGARDLLGTVLDAGSWQSWDEPPVISGDPPPSAYAAELAAAAVSARTDESVITGTGRISGRTIAIVVSEFRFLAGSIGRAATERLVLAVERATREGLPLLAAPSSGGTRMQEGTRAFVGMIKIAAAIAQHKAVGLPYIVYLRHPTTGGVLASWGSLGQFTAAEPGALIGFLGPRVYEALFGTQFPSGVQTAENLYQRGLVDAVLPVNALAGVATQVLNVLMSPQEDPPTLTELPKDTLPDTPAWESVQRSRRPDRPGVCGNYCGWLPPMSCLSTEPARANMTPAFSSPWPVSAGCPASCWVRIAIVKRSTGSWGRPACALRAGACDWPANCTCH